MYDLQQPDYRDTLNYTEGYNDDLRNTIHKNFPTAVKQTKSFAQQFKGDTPLETAYNVWKFIKTHCTYQKDEPEKQCVKLPSRFIHDNGFSDCKSFALTAAALLANNGLPVSFRYANYRGGNIPSHVYTITADSNGKEIIVDAVYKFFNSEKRPTYKFDEPMKIYTLSGIGATAAEAAPTKFVKHPHFWAWVQKRSAARNLDLAAIRKNDYARYKLIMGQFQKSFKTRNLERKLKSKLRRKLYSGSYHEMVRGINEDLTDPSIGSFFGKLFKGVKKVVSAPFKLGFKAVKAATGFAWRIGKKVALAPSRTAFRGLVHINFKGLAQKLKRVNDKDPQGLKKKWESLGGSYNDLLKSVRHGYNNWAKKHNKGAMTGIYAVDLPVIYGITEKLGLCNHAINGEDEDIGALPVAAVLGLAGAIIAALGGLMGRHGGNPEAEAAGTESSTTDLIQAAADGVQAFNNSLPSGSPALTMEDPTDPSNASNYDLQKTLDDSPETTAGFSLNLPTILLLGGGAALALGALKKSKK